ncbi:MAG: LPS export ABC transporter periplasmic protein LptC [bacterium]
MNYKVKSQKSKVKICLTSSAFSLLLIFASCGKEKRIVSPPCSLIKKSVLTSSKSGKKTWRLTSERISMADNKTYLYEVRLELFKDKEVECTITGNCGVIEGDKISLKGSITASTKSGATLTTSSLQFCEKSNALSTNDRVSFIKKGLILRGSGLIADRSLGNVKIKKDVEVLFK